jgi:DNA-binding FadR family transcriptional regulator
MTRETQAKWDAVPVPSAPPTGRHAGLLDELGRSVVAGERAVGSVLTVEELCTTYAVSRSVAREAVRVLESMGLLVARRRVGSTVQPRERWNVFDPRVIRWRLAGSDRGAQLASLSELRLGIEPVAAALAAARATPEQCRALAVAAADMAVHRRAGEIELYLGADTLFHTTLLEASGNEMLRALHEVVAEVLAGRTHHGMLTDPRAEAVALHDDVARAVRLGDGVAAESAMRAIIDEAAAAMRAELTG